MDKPTKKKVLLYSLGGTALVVIVAVIALFLSLNGIVRKAVADSATQGLKVKTTVGAAAVSPFGGNVALSDMTIASPEGFAAPHLFTLGNVAVDVRYGELFGQPVQVSKISIRQPRLVIEHVGGKLNVRELIGNLDAKKPAPTDRKTDPVKLVIDQLDVEGATIEIRPGIPGFDKPITLTLPAMSVQNVGNAEGNRNGEEIGRVVGDLAQLFVRQAAESDALPPEVRQLLKLDLGAIKDQAMQRVGREVDKGRERIGTELEKGRGKLDQEIDKGLGKLLGGRKDGADKGGDKGAEGK
jgi:hypothetical protein